MVPIGGELYITEGAGRSLSRSLVGRVEGAVVSVGYAYRVYSPNGNPMPWVSPVPVPTHVVLRVPVTESLTVEFWEAWVTDLRSGTGTVIATEYDNEPAVVSMDDVHDALVGARNRADALNAPEVVAMLAEQLGIKLE